MEQAAAVWERTLRDPVTVQIDVYETDATELGGAQGATAVTYDFIDYGYADFRAALIADATSSDDASAIAHLPPGPRIAFRGWNSDMEPELFQGDEWANNYLSVPRATAKALGLSYEIDGPDAEIYWNASVLDNGFDYDRSDGIDGTDFLAVAMHEIGHALGFTSTVSFVELVFSGDIPFPPEYLPDLPLVEPLDLLRYSPDSAPYIDISPGGSPYFSIDGGATNLATFASGEVFGNGDQPDHWQGGSGIMDARLQQDQVHNLAAVDRLALDVIGWDLALAGDYNSDGTVNAADYTVWRDGLGSTFPRADYEVWKAHFGQTYDGGAGAVPSVSTTEPTTIFLFLFGAHSLFSRRRGLMLEMRRIGGGLSSTCCR
ncbi:MAG: NF038122 family metalloprotease [Pirellulales bacterium]